MAKVELYINGYFEITFLNPITKEAVEDDTQLGIMDNLQQGEYLIGMEDRTVKNINDLQTVLYTFDLDPTTSMRYEFEEL